MWPLAHTKIAFTYFTFVDVKQTRHFQSLVQLYAITISDTEEQICYCSKLVQEQT
jgi:hypothetical protein